MNAHGFFLIPIFLTKIEKRKKKKGKLELQTTFSPIIYGYFITFLYFWSGFGESHLQRY